MTLFWFYHRISFFSLRASSLFTIAKLFPHHIYKPTERSGYWGTTSFLKDAQKEYETTGEIKFYDSNTGQLLYVAPKGRTFEQFIRESGSHGWPSFRDEEVVWDNGVRVLPNGETVSLAGTHLGHNLPDSKGNRYCINLISVAGNPSSSSSSSSSTKTTE